MRSVRVILLAVTAGAILTASGFAQEVVVPGPSFEDLLSLERVNSQRISPDGKSIVYTVRTTDWDKNRYDTEIWLARDAEDPLQLTNTKDGNSTRPRWSPDGEWIAFLSKRGEKTQIYLIRAGGGEAWALTEAKEDASGFAWAPDGRSIAFWMTDPESEEDEQRVKKYGSFAVEDAEYRQRHLWLVTLPDISGSVEAERLTEGDDFTVSSFAWSPDGTRIALARQPDPLINTRMHADIWMLDVATREMTPLVTEPGSETNPMWSPDGQWLAYQSSGPDIGSAFFKNGFLFKIPADGGTPIRLAADLDEDPNLIDWNRGGIYLGVRQRTKRQIYRVDPNSGRATPFVTSPDNVWSVHFSADGEMMALRSQTPTTVAEVYRSSVASYDPVRVTNMSMQIANWKLGTSEVIEWTSADGTRIEGVLHKPNDFDSSVKYPLFVVIHGGPTGVDYPIAVTGSVYPIHQWLAKGALVLRPNYRGSAGYGEAFRSLNVGNLGVGDMWDVMSGVDHLVSRGMVDTTRMAAMGWSQGGYISAFLTTNTNRFAAISVGAGISNWVTYYVNTDIHPFTRQYLRATPWDDPAIYAKTSPMTNITHATTPTLIQHGEFDRRVPIPNAYELYQGLRDMGVESKLIVYKGFGHGITKPKERLAAIWHNWQWFAKPIWNEDVTVPVDVTEQERN